MGCTSFVPLQQTHFHAPNHTTNFGMEFDPKKIFPWILSQHAATRKQPTPSVIRTESNVRRRDFWTMSGFGATGSELPCNACRIRLVLPSLISIEIGSTSQSQKKTRCFSEVRMRSKSTNPASQVRPSPMDRSHLYHRSGPAWCPIRKSETC